MSEQDYINGTRAVWADLLGQAVKALGYQDATQHEWITEREAAVAVLRRLCEEYGDNDWPDELHLADVIEKHLGRHLDYVNGLYKRGS